MTDLAGTQISNLLETLPGIAQVLRSPVADAFVNLIQAASGRGEFDPADAEEIMQYAVRRNLIGAEEAERVVEEAREAGGPRRRQASKTARKVKTPKKPKPGAKKKAVKSAPKPKVVKKARPKAKTKRATPKRAKSASRSRSVQRKK